MTDIIKPEARVSFTQIPTLSLGSALSANTKPDFLASLRTALLRTGFLYLTDTGLPDDLTKDVVEQTRLFFESLPEDEKLRIEMKNERSFLGYNRLGNEVTAGEKDWREQLDLVRVSILAQEHFLHHHC